MLLTVLRSPPLLVLIGLVFCVRSWGMEGGCTHE